MATILRDWSYRYQWLYDGISRIASLAVGGEARFRQLALEGIDITPESTVLDLCCGCGQTTQFLVQRSRQVTGLDASPFSIQRAQRNVPEATYVEAFAEAMPFADATFDIVHTSAAMHEMTPKNLQRIFQEAYRVLKPGGYFLIADFHRPQPWMMPGIALFFGLFETETAWQLLDLDLVKMLQEAGFTHCDRQLYAGDSLQVLQAQKKC
ncbi:class I SAM-dependent methyltransferase [Alkalinema sp. FACHB-956]|uniref:class I SAM-dependent methyltransferase n=1 Tax=Alkalinema sp. FACHB-956 TaxID=2692768 RepID=UPI001687086E|nr:class I SAM-dependent methyltransferase [Alkalinema sp. FACHB-956]MBD2326959.1 methyltransferase domain-containing protein [Alkalinema sp. FACHB-956]